MANSNEAMEALAGAYGSALRRLLLDAIDDGFWVDRGLSVHWEDRLVNLDLNWKTSAGQPRHCTLIDEES